MAEFLKPSQISSRHKLVDSRASYVGDLLGRIGVQGIRVSTFHSLGLAILRAERERLGLRPRFSIFDPLDSVARVSELLLAEGAKAQDTESAAMFSGVEDGQHLGISRILG